MCVAVCVAVCCRVCCRLYCSVSVWTTSRPHESNWVCALVCCSVCCSVLQSVLHCVSMNHIATPRVKLSFRCSTEWWRLVGCLIFTGHFLQKNPIISGSFAKKTCNLMHAVGLRHSVTFYCSERSHLFCLVFSDVKNLANFSAEKLQGTDSCVTFIHVWHSCIVLRHPSVVIPCCIITP